MVRISLKKREIDYIISQILKHDVTEVGKAILEKLDGKGAFYFKQVGILGLQEIYDKIEAIEKLND